MVAELRSLLLHELVESGGGGMARHEDEELMIRRSAAVEPGQVIVDRLIDRGIRIVGRDDVHQERCLRAAGAVAVIGFELALPRSTRRFAAALHAA